MNHQQLLIGVMAVLCRISSMIILGYMLSRQWKILRLNIKDDSQTLRQLLFNLLQALFLQNIIPVLTVIVSVYSGDQNPPIFYWINNAFFSLLISIVLLNLYIKE